MNDFLKVEYEQCLSLIKHYDDRQMAYMKFASGLSSSVISIIFAFHKLKNGTTVIDWGFISIISLVTSLSLLSLLLAMIQNRLYFVYPARQVNALRNTFLLQVADEFKENQMYTSTKISAFKWFSAQSFMVLFVIVQIGIYVGLLHYSFIFATTNEAPCLLWSIIISILFTVILYAILRTYLVVKSKQSADESVHSYKTGEK